MGTIRFFFKTSMLLCCCMLLACSQQNNPDAIEMDFAFDNSGSIKTLKPDTTENVSLDLALSIAAKSFDNSASRGRPRVVETCKCIFADDGTPLIYVVNYANNDGFMLISATKKYFPIIAESDEGNFNISETDNAHPAAMWLSQQCSTIANVGQLPESIKRIIDSEWMAFSNPQLIENSRSSDIEKPQVYYDSLKVWTLDPNIEVYLYDDYINTQEYQSLSQTEKDNITAGIHMYGNEFYGTPESSTIVLRYDTGKKVNTGELLKTKWRQNYGYNASVPSGVRVGCAPVAAGQIMKYHKQPTSISWDLMPDNKPSSETSNFLYSLGQRMGIKYEDGKSEASDNQAKLALESYGYNVTLQSHNAQSVYAQVVKGLPVYMGGYASIIKDFWGNKTADDGHAWVCDGVHFYTTEFTLRIMCIEYRPTPYSTPKLMVEAYKNSWLISPGSITYHYNWGWNGDGDGYFRDNDITVTIEGQQHDYKFERSNLLINPSR